MYLNIQGFPLERHEARSLSFTEELAFWTLPLEEVNFVCDVAVTKGVVRKATNFCNEPHYYKYYYIPQLSILGLIYSTCLSATY